MAWAMANCWHVLGHASCASDGDGLHPGLCSLLESFIGCLAVEAAVGLMVVVEVLPFVELVVEELGVVDHDPVQEAVELLGVDAMGALDLAVEPRRPGLMSTWPMPLSRTYQWRRTRPHCRSG